MLLSTMGSVAGPPVEMPNTTKPAFCMVGTERNGFSDSGALVALDGADGAEPRKTLRRVFFLAQ